VKVDGVEKLVTVDELTKDYELRAASQARMAEAAELKKQSAKDVEISGAVERLIKNQDTEALRVIAQHYDIPKDQVDTWISTSQNFANQGNSDSTDDPPAGSQVDEDTPLALTFEDFDPKMREVLGRMATFMDQSQQTQAYTAEQEMYQEAENAVDKDEVLGKMENEALKVRARKFVRHEVQRRVFVQGEPRPDALREAIQEARTHFESVGTQSQTNQFNTPPGLGPGVTMVTGPQSKEPIKPVSVRDKAYGRNFVQRLLQKRAKYDGK